MVQIALIEESGVSILAKPAEVDVLFFANEPRKLTRSELDRRRGELTLRAGQGGFIPAGLESEWESETNGSVLHIHFERGRLASLFERREVGRDPIFPIVSERQQPLVAHLVALLKEQETSGLMIESIALALSSFIFERARKPASARGLAAWRLQRAQDRMMADLAEDLSLDVLARDVGLSPWHFCRAFKASTGLAPHRWRLERRLEHARALLETSDLTVTDIAAAIGYDDPGQLSAAFRRRFGGTPSGHRRARRS